LTVCDIFQEFKQSMIEVVELSSREIGEVENRVRDLKTSTTVTSGPPTHHAGNLHARFIGQVQHKPQLENEHAHSQLFSLQVARVESEIPAAAKGGGRDSVGVEELSRVLRLVETMNP